jgi:hypothetical protein
VRHVVLIHDELAAIPLHHETWLSLAVFPLLIDMVQDDIVHDMALVPVMHTDLVPAYPKRGGFVVMVVESVGFLCLHGVWYRFPRL